MDPGPGLPEKMRDEHPGDEGLPGPLPPRGGDHPPAEGDAGQKAGRPTGLHPRTGGQRGLYPLEAVVLRRSALRPTPLCEQPDRPQRVTRRQKKARQTAVPFAWNVLRCLVREIEKEHDPRRAPFPWSLLSYRVLEHPQRATSTIDTAIDCRR